MADTEHDIAVQVAEDKRAREGVASNAAVARLGNMAIPGNNTNTAGVTTNPLAEPTAERYVPQAERRTHPLRTEGDWQHRDRIEALLADELADATECDRIGGEPTIVRPCPATDYCVFHHPDSLPCEDATCPAVIAAWTKEATE